jgi:hypothetical protein
MEVQDSIHFSGCINIQYINIPSLQINSESTYSTEEGNEWEKDRRNKIPNVKIRQMIAQESVWKALLTSFCISRAVALSLLRSG